MEEEAKKLVKSFYKYLKQEKGLSEETASAHAHHIRFFALHYLLGYEEKNLQEVTDRDIGDYLGNWYIRKVWGGGKSEVRPILTAFKKFYKFLHECGRVDKKYLFVEWTKEFCMEHGDAEDMLNLLLPGAKLLYGVFDGRSVPALKLFGLLDFGHEKARKEYFVNRGLGIEWFAITKLGKKIFRGCNVK